MKNYHVNISQGSSNIRARVISTNHSFFDTDSIIVTITETFIKFRKPDLDYTGKTFKPNKTRSGWFTFTLAGYLPIRSNIQFDRVYSTEDELVILI